LPKQGKAVSSQRLVKEQLPSIRNSLSRSMEAQAASVGNSSANCSSASQAKQFLCLEYVPRWPWKGH
jgi:hypothetical protein